jgi:hypothetical protein
VLSWFKRKVDEQKAKFEEHHKQELLDAKARIKIGLQWRPVTAGQQFPKDIDDDWPNYLLHVGVMKADMIPFSNDLMHPGPLHRYYVAFSADGGSTVSTDALNTWMTNSKNSVYHTSDLSQDKMESHHVKLKEVNPFEKKLGEKSTEGNKKREIGRKISMMFKHGMSIPLIADVMDMQSQDVKAELATSLEAMSGFSECDFGYSFVQYVKNPARSKIHLEIWREKVNVLGEAVLGSSTSLGQVHLDVGELLTNPNMQMEFERLPLLKRDGQTKAGPRLYLRMELWSVAKPSKAEPRSPQLPLPATAAPHMVYYNASQYPTAASGSASLSFAVPRRV